MPRIFNDERGALDITTLVIALPIILLLFSSMYDLLRLPFAKNQAQEALHNGAYGVEEYVASLGAASTVHLTDLATPAGNCFSGVKNTPCTYSSNGNAFLQAPQVAELYANAACDLAAKNLSSVNGSFSVADKAGGKTFALQFGIFRFKYNSPTTITVYPVYTTGTQCGSAFGSMPFPASTQGVVSVTNSMKAILESQTGTIPGAGSWPIVGTNAQYYLDSLWLVGVAQVQTGFMTGFFSSSDTIVESFVRPMNVPSGIMVNVAAM